MSRPSKHSNELAEQICLEIIEGKSIREICKSDDYPCIATIFNWLSNNDEFLEQYEKAKDIQSDVMAEDILSIADNATGDVQRDRLRIDARKWIASKLKPKKYGQNSQIDIADKNNKITTVMLRTDFSDPIDFKEFSDSEVVEFARESNQKRIDELRDQHRQ